VNDSPRKRARKLRRFIVRVDVHVADVDGGSPASPGFSITMERSCRAFTDVIELAYPKWLELARELEEEDP
jgi:hypothetical protein